jgi:hypothetical protein
VAQVSSVVVDGLARVTVTYDELDRNVRSVAIVNKSQKQTFWFDGTDILPGRLRAFTRSVPPGGSLTLTPLAARRFSVDEDFNLSFWFA